MKYNVQKIELALRIDIENAGSGRSKESVYAEHTQWKDDNLNRITKSLIDRIYKEREEYGGYDDPVLDAMYAASVREEIAREDQ